MYKTLRSMSTLSALKFFLWWQVFVSSTIIFGTLIINVIHLMLCFSQSIILHPEIMVTNRVLIRDKHFINNFDMLLNYPEKRCFISLILFVTIFGIFECMPLSYWTPWGCQHVRPMSQFCTTRIVAQHDITNGFWRTNAIVIHHSYHEIHFLQFQ